LFLAQSALDLIHHRLGDIGRGRLPFCGQADFRRHAGNKRQRSQPFRLGGLRPYDCIFKIWTSKVDRFILNPIHQMPGLNTGMRSADALSFSDAQCDRSHSDRTLARHQRRPIETPNLRPR